MVIDNETQFEAVTKVANALPQLREANFTIFGETSWLSNLTINNITSKILFLSLSLQTNYLLIVKN